MVFHCRVSQLLKILHCSPVKYIVFVSLIGAEMQGGAMAYRASKAALNMLAACYAEEQAKDGVKVLALHPGE